MHRPNFTLEQFRTLDAIASSGSIKSAAHSLSKVHSAVLYSMKELERLSGVKIFDRSRYRVGLTPAGVRVWQESKRLLAVESEIVQMMALLQSGWEPLLQVVFDGSLPFEYFLRTFKDLKKINTPTKLMFFAEYLSEVETRFHLKKADIMVSVVPPKDKTLISKIYKGPKLVLVTSQQHTLHARFRKNTPWTLKDLNQHTYLTVKEDSSQLHLPTGALDQSAQLQVSDFTNKKQALIAGVGFGWMPLLSIEKELSNGTLRKLKFEGTNEVNLKIYISYHDYSCHGKTANLVIQNLQKYFSN